MTPESLPARLKSLMAEDRELWAENYAELYAALRLFLKPRLEEPENWTAALAWFKNIPFVPAYSFLWKMFLHEDGPMKNYAAVYLARMRSAPEFHRLLTWPLLKTVGPGLGLRFAPAAYCASMLAEDPSGAVALLAGLAEKNFDDFSAESWAAAALELFAAGSQAAAASLAEKIEQRWPGEAKGPEAREMLARLRLRLKVWPAPAAGLRLGLFQGQALRPQDDSGDPADYLQSLALLTAFILSGGGPFEGGLNRLRAEELRRALNSGPAEMPVSLVEIYRDHPGPGLNPDEPLWVFASGPFSGRDLPFHPALRPFFIGFQLADQEPLSAAALDYLRRYQPIGCRDWPTAEALGAYGLAVFWSGDLVAMLGQLNGPARELLEIDPGKILGADSQLSAVLAARALGLAADPTLPGEGAPLSLSWEELAELDQKALEKLGRRQLEKIRLIFPSLGQSEGAVYNQWRRICAPEVLSWPVWRRPPRPLPSPSGRLLAARDRIGRTAWRVNPAPSAGRAAAEVALAFDRNLAAYAPALMRSLVAHSAFKPRFHLLLRGLSAQNARALSDLLPGLDLTFYFCDEAVFGSEVGLLSYTTVSTLDRLLLPALLESPRVLYLDVDTLVVDNIDFLFTMDLGAHLFAAKKEAYERMENGRFRACDQAWGILQHRRWPGLDPEELYARRRTLLARFGPLDRPYFNAGVLVMNLERWRARQSDAEALALVEHFQFHDQDAINLAAGDQALELPMEYNVMNTINYTDRPKIIHWANIFKPWRAYYVPWQEKWQAAHQAADLTWSKV